MPKSSDPTHDDDLERVEVLHRYQVVDAPVDQVLTRVAALAAQLFDTPMAVVSMADHDRIWFSATHGLNNEIRQIPRAEGLCAEAITGAARFVVIPNARQDPATATNQFVQDYRIAFYACAPIVTFQGHRLGTVAVMDTEERSASTAQLAALESLAAIVMEQLELRLSALDALRLERRQRVAAESARDDARLDSESAQQDRDQARRDRDDAKSDRNDAELGHAEARRDRDDAQRGRRDALRDRDIAERERDEIEVYASVLQQTLLPPSLPEIDGLSLASHYHPADPRQVGGDFYDVFALDKRRWAYFIGDVQGHGASAAVATSLIRYTLRSAALHESDPTDVLRVLNEVMLREANPRRFCTVLFGTLVPGAVGEGYQITVATGGHLPALLIDSDNHTVNPVRSATGMLVGATPNATFDSCGVVLRPGQTLLFYTDGLVEARRGANPFDEDSLAAFALERASLDAAALVGELTTLIPKLEPDDDVAILAISAQTSP
ncbi:SpoIIE family protein phosphatase [Mycolicibacterium sp. Dal123E01]|uniref:SpoIIE family protein phosphatase n=1 Tax=Mycolicibacterium sp. Dal123E01 TaxID=3457578 RepID=UPI00403E9425